MIQFKRNELVKPPYSKDTSIYLILSGCVSLSLIDNEGQELIIRFGYDNELVTALDGFLKDSASPLQIKALKKTTVQKIEREAFLHKLQEKDTYSTYWIKTLESLVLAHMEREQDLLLSKPKDRYQRVLERSPQLFQHVPHRHIANYLRMTPETLSRLTSNR